MNTNKLTILILHLVVAIILGYLSYMILYKKQIPNFIGVLLSIGALFVAVVHVYFYNSKNHNKTYEDEGDLHELTTTRNNKKENCNSISKHEEHDNKLQGFYVNPSDSRFQPIGGMPKGVTWI